MLSFCAAQANSVSFPNPPDSAAARAAFDDAHRIVAAATAGQGAARRDREEDRGRAPRPSCASIPSSVDPSTRWASAGARSLGGRALAASLAHRASTPLRDVARSRLYAWAVVAGSEEDGTCGSPSGIPAGSPPSWRAAPRSGSRRRSSLLRLLGPSELAVIPTEAWPWSSESVGVDGVGFDTQFRAGDRVVAMDGVPMDTWVSWAIGPPWQPPPGHLGDEVAFGVIRDGAPTTLDVPLGRFPLERLGGAPISLIVFGAGVLVLALILVLRRTRATALRLLFVGAAANVADIAAWELGLQPTDFGLPGPTLFVFGAASLFNIVFWATIVHILAIYPVRSPLAGRRPAVDPGSLRRPAARVLRARGGRPGSPAARPSTGSTGSPPAWRSSDPGCSS